MIDKEIIKSDLYANKLVYPHWFLVNNRVIDGFNILINDRDDSTDIQYYLFEYIQEMCF